ncbi:HD domain-containing protein [Clostridium sp. CX1]|uniref:HD domain-containing protein n=1 Tax=Clostridium sp. CX1 TaxID=2978346 RepID=UPI0021C16442|nr:HD domain-containing protein [Clostridium sp. CX1]MCT8978283.1 HD domain-containing protein [Clostridium sp. CX1]
MKDIQEVKEKVIELLSNTQRKGMDRVIKYLEESDFFVAPASTKYHGNYEGGLAEHSLNVYDLFSEKNKRFNLGLGEDSVAIAALLHDFCKINFYNKQTCWRKNDSNRWESYEGYKVQDDFPIGHGEKTIIMLQCFIRLTKEEILMMRWHMGSSEPKEMQMNISNAYNLVPAAAALHTADMEASYLLEEHFEPGENNGQTRMKGMS